MTHDNPYPGGENATRDRIRRYLKANYTNADGSVLSDARLTELLTEHDTIVERGRSTGSFIYYIGDQIAEAAGLAFHDGLGGGAKR